jgi:hypothetical protein
MNKTFGDLVRGIVEVYVDDIVVKTKEGSTLLEDLTLVFDRLRTTRTKLNPEKCVFGVSATVIRTGPDRRFDRKNHEPEGPTVRFT